MENENLSEEVLKWLETQGFEVTYLDVDQEGFISPEDLKQAITDKTILVSIIHGNNEIGTIQDLEKLVQQKRYPNRSEAIRVAVRDLLKSEAWNNG